MKPLLKHTLAWTSSPWGRGVMVLLLLTLASGLSRTPAGLAALAAALLLGYANPRLGLMLLFGSAFLPYVWGLPVTAGFVVIIALLPSLLVGWRETLSHMPRQLAMLLALLFALIIATYPFHKPIDLELLALGLIGLSQALLFASRSTARATHIVLDLGLALTAVLFLPLITNSILGWHSPFWLPSHLGDMLLGRVAVGVTELNMLGAYVAAVYAVYLFCARLRGRSRSFHLLYVLLGLVLLFSLNAIGSRAAMAMAGLVTLAALALAYTKARAGQDSQMHCWRSVRFAAASTVLMIVLVFSVATAAAGSGPKGIIRLLETAGMEETGRPKSFRDAADRLDSVPLAGFDLEEYVSNVAHHTPHSSLAAGLLFLGLFVSLALYALLLFPVYDTLLGSRLSEAPVFGVGLLTLLATTLAIPLTSDRGMLVLLGVWFAYSKLPRLGDAAVATRRRIAPSVPV